MTRAGDPLRIYISGLPGNGKTTLAKELGTRSGVPVFALDEEVWGPDGAILPFNERWAISEKVAAEPRWIAEGGYVKWTRSLLERAHVVVVLDVPLRSAWLRILRRHIGAEFRRENPRPGWGRLLRFMRSVLRKYRGSYPAATPQDLPVSRDAIMREAEEFGDKLLVNPSADEVLALARKPGEVQD